MTRLWWHSRLYSAPVFFIYPIFFSPVIRPRLLFPLVFFSLSVFPFLFSWGGWNHAVHSRLCFFLSPLFFILRWIRGRRGEVHPGCYRSVRSRSCMMHQRPYSIEFLSRGFSFRLCFFLSPLVGSMTSIVLILRPIFCNNNVFFFSGRKEKGIWVDVMCI